MHEYSIVQALMERVDLEASAGGASSVYRIHVSIGELAGVDIPLLQTAFETFREAIPLCRGAELEVRQIEMRWSCPGCGRAISRGEILRCGTCQRPARLEQGDEIFLERIEMEVS